uniref:Uncharacterized protein n=1 Tax=Lotharella globosa TaxID=91324 RepID=A0A7S3ZGH2_9EUKA
MAAAGAGGVGAVLFSALAISLVACAIHVTLVLLSQPSKSRAVLFLVAMLLAYQTFAAYHQMDKVFWLLLGVTSPLCAMFVGAFVGLIPSVVFVWIMGVLVMLGATLFAYLSAVVGSTRNMPTQEILILVGLILPACGSVAWLVTSNEDFYRLGIILSICSSLSNILFNKDSGSALYGLDTKQFDNS